VNRDLARRVRERAEHRCEYCRLPQFVLPLPFQIDHIVAEQHGGQTEEGNLAFACPSCNRYKGPNIAGRDGETGKLVRLFHPRTDHWSDHFESAGGSIVARTAVGRVTLQVLRMNAPDRVSLREHLALEDKTGS
jgi:hypothetical protein